MTGEIEMRRLAKEDPAELLSQMRTMAPTRLTYAAEALGLAEPTDEVVEALEELAGHAKGYVREGAALGLVALVENLRTRLATLEAALTELVPVTRGFYSHWKEQVQNGPAALIAGPQPDWNSMSDALTKGRKALTRASQKGSD